MPVAIRTEKIPSSCIYPVSCNKVHILKLLQPCGEIRDEWLHFWQIDIQWICICDMAFIMKINDSCVGV